MRTRKLHRIFFIVISMFSIASLGIVAIGEGAEKGKTSCSMNFTLKGWSAVYQTATGTGTITCDNGQSARVVLDVKGGGITAGKREIEKGEGKFSEVSGIDELFGPYVKAEAHAGVVKSATAQVMTKGEVSLV